jgi:ATP-dependent DNA helicase RecG
MLIKENPKISREQLSKKLNINPLAVQRHIEKLKEKSVLERVGPDKGGYWEIKEDNIKYKSK